MSQYIGYGLSIFTFFLGRYLGKRDQREQFRRQKILDLYPPLLDNLRDSIVNNISRYEFGGVGKPGFQVLTDMFDNGTIKLIEANDEELYLDLIKIRNEVIPALRKCYDEKHEIHWQNVKPEWISFINSRHDDFDIEKLVDVLFSALNWSIWRNQNDLAQNNFEEILKQNSGEFSMLGSSDITLKNFMDIANTEFDKSRNEFEGIKLVFENLIMGKIIPRMEETIKGLM